MLTVLINTIPRIMKKINSLGYSSGKVLRILVLLMIITLSACSKNSDSFSPAVQPPASTSPPSGEIQSFTLSDTLVAFNTGSTAKWFVTSTNDLTIVTFNGVKVAFSGVLDTGPIKQATKFTLAVNSGKQSSLTLKVADSLTSQLWNKGKRLKQKKIEWFIAPAGQTEKKWVDTTSSLLTPRLADQRTYFYLDGSTKIIQVTPLLYPPPNEAGKFIANAALPGYTWQNTQFLIEVLTDNYLVVTYNATQPNGSWILVRNTYSYE